MKKTGKWKQVKAKNFIKVAEKRMDKALNDLRLIGNLSNTLNYAYTEEQVSKIMSTLREKVNEIESQFTNTKTGKKRFTF